MSTVTRRSKPTLNGHGESRAHMADAVDTLLDEGKKYAHELYEEGLVKAGAVEKELEKYSEDLINKVRENPLKAVLIAGGVGFLLSALLKK